jgi:hypothetical protein
VEHSRSWEVIQEKLNESRRGQPLISLSYTRSVITVGDLHPALGIKLETVRQTLTGRKRLYQEISLPPDSEVDESERTRTRKKTRDEVEK